MKTWKLARIPNFGSEPFARVDQIDCDLRWHSLWRSRMDFAHLHLDHPSFNIVLNSRGDWNVEKLLLQSGVTAPAGAAAGGQTFRWRRSNWTWMWMTLASIFRWDPTRSLLP